MKQLSLIFAMVLLVGSMAFAQRTVTGTVTDSDGEPLISANVVIKGTTTGTLTDFNGKYSIEVPDGTENPVLVVSYIGFESQELDLGASNVMNVVLLEGVTLNEAVVTALGLESNRRELGYSVQNVDPNDVLSSGETNFVDALNSKVAGVTVVSSAGSPGASSNIRVRGSISVNGSNSPLFVVDGVPIDNDERGNAVDGVDLSNRAIDINPNDIESITVLKGAAATALYGVRAASGAVIVTTKSGTSGKPKVNVSFSYGLDEVNKLPERQSAYAQGRPSGGELIWRGPNTFEGFSWGPAISTLEYDGVPTVWDPNGSLVPAGQGNGQPANIYDPYDFWVTGSSYDANISVEGGNDRVNYYISGGRRSSDGIVPNSTFQRNSLRVNTNAKIWDDFTVGLSANYVNSGGNRIQRGSNLQGVMLGLMRTTPTFDNGLGLTGNDAANNLASYQNEDGSQRSYRDGIYDNPYWTVNKNPFKDVVNRLIGHASFRYEPLDWLTINYKLGTDFYSDRRNFAQDINRGVGGNLWNAGSVDQSLGTNRDMNSDFIVTVDRQISDDFSVTASVGQNFFDSRFVEQSSSGTTLAISDFYHISNASNVTSDEEVLRKRIHAVYATVDLAYADYIFLNLTGRNDWSSSLPKENNAFQSYSASLGFTLTEALGVSQNKYVPYAKLRASYGKVGNDAPIYATTNYFNAAISDGDGFISGVEFPAFGVNAFEPSTILGNANLVPESTTTWELGAELRFHKNRAGIDVTYFNSTSKDQVIQVQLPATTGFTDIIQNAGQITSKGWEISADVNPVRIKNKFRWDIEGNFTKITNTVDSLASGIEQIALAGFTSTSSRVVVGQPYGAIFGSGFQRNENGDILIDANGWPLQDPNTGVYGDPNPDWTMGIRNTFTLFNNIRISALLDFRQGGDMWCGTCGVIDYFGTSAITGELREQSVVWPGVSAADGTPNTISVPYADPAAGVGGSYWVRYGFGGITEMSIYDTSWIRLRELTVSYTLPDNIFKNSNTFSNVSLTFTGRNLWLNTDYPGIDPETNLTGASNGFGLDYFNMPNAKSYVFTLNASF
ncbi:MAG: SusC/RagA family TonB-linked outer membrane protein [Bacteroidota bacterium]